MTTVYRQLYIKQQVATTVEQTVVLPSLFRDLLRDKKFKLLEIDVELADYSGHKNSEQVVALGRNQSEEIVPSNATVDGEYHYAETIGVFFYHFHSFGDAAEWDGVGTAIVTAVPTGITMHHVFAEPIEFDEDDSLDLRIFAYNASAGSADQFTKVVFKIKY